MSSEAQVAYSFERGELQFISTHRHAYEPGVKIVSAAVILFHTTCAGDDPLINRKLLASRLEHSDDNGLLNSSLGDISDPAKGTDEPENIPVSFSLLPIPEQKYKDLSSSLEHDSPLEESPREGTPGLTSAHVPTVFDALADVVQQTESLEQIEAASSSLLGQVVSPRASVPPRGNSSRHGQEESHLSQFEPQDALFEGSETMVQFGQHPQWLQCCDEKQEVARGDKTPGEEVGMLNSQTEEQEQTLEMDSLSSYPSQMVDSREPPGTFDGSLPNPCPVIKIEPLSPEAEEPAYPLLEQGVSNPQPWPSKSLDAEGVNTCNFEALMNSADAQRTPGSEGKGTTTKLEVVDDMVIVQHPTASASPSAAAATAVAETSTGSQQFPSETSGEMMQTGSSAEPTTIDLTSIKEEPKSDEDDDLQELSVSFAPEVQHAGVSKRENCGENSSFSAAGAGHNFPWLKASTKAPVPRLVPSSLQSAHSLGIGRPPSRPLSRPLSRLFHRPMSWRTYRQPLQQALKTAKKRGSFSSLRGRLAVASGRSCRCGICSGEISCYQDFVHHMRLHNKGQLGHTCPVCLKTFKSRTQITYRHSAIHVLRDLYTCPLCGIEITRKDSFKRHFTLTHPGDTAILLRYLQNYSRERKLIRDPSDVPSSSAFPSALQQGTMPRAVTGASYQDGTNIGQHQGSESCSNWGGPSALPNRFSHPPVSLPQPQPSQRKDFPTVLSSRNFQSCVNPLHNTSPSTVTSTECSFPHNGVFCSYCGQNLQNLSQLLYHGDIHGPQAGTSSQSLDAPYTCPLCQEMHQSLQSLEMHVSDRHNLSQQSGGCGIGSSRVGSAGDRTLGKKISGESSSAKPQTQTDPNRSVEMQSRSPVRGNGSPSSMHGLSPLHGSSPLHGFPSKLQQSSALPPSSTSAAAVFAKPLPLDVVPPLPRLLHKPSLSAPLPPALNRAPLYTSSSLSDSGASAGHSALSGSMTGSGSKLLALCGSQGYSMMSAGSGLGSSGERIGSSASVPSTSSASMSASILAAVQKVQGLSTSPSTLGFSPKFLSPKKEPRVRSNFSSCSFCQAVITNKEDFMHHVNIHGCLSPIVKCPICKQVFSYKAILVRHSTSHLTKEWFCGICKNTFARSDSYKRHLRLLHGGSMENL